MFSLFHKISVEEAVDPDQRVNLHNILQLSGIHGSERTLSTRAQLIVKYLRI